MDSNTVEYIAWKERMDRGAENQVLWIRTLRTIRRHTNAWINGQRKGR